MERFRDQTELYEGVVNQLIDEEVLGVCFEMHRAIRLGYYELLYPKDRCGRPLRGCGRGAWFNIAPLSLSLSPPSAVSMKSRVSPLA